MCVLIAAIAIYVRKWQETDRSELLANIQKELPAVIGEQHDFLLVDVRTPNEYNQGHVPGAVNIPHKQIIDKVPSVKPDRDALILLYCKTGIRAEIAKETLEEAGYKNTINLNRQLEEEND